MKNIHFFLLLTLSITSRLTGMSTYDQAVLLTQKGDWEKANEALQSVVVNRHESPKILYDAGVTSFKTKQYKEAAAYFEHAATHKNTEATLKEHALFNAGNTYVALDDLPKAITAYETILKTNPNHGRAQHNLAKVKELLKKQQEQNQQEQKKESSDKESEQQQKQSPGSDKNSGNTQKEEQQSNNTDNNQKRDKQQQLDKKPGQEQQKEQQQNSSDHTNTPKKQSPQQSPTQQQKPQPSSKQKSQGQSPENQKTSPLAPKPSPVQDTAEQKRAQETNKSQEQPKTPQEQWLADLFEERDKADAESSKELMKAIIGTQTTRPHGNTSKKCW